MKKLITSLTLIFLMVFSIAVNAQYCGSTVTSSCSPPYPGSPGFPSLDSIPCVITGGTLNNFSIKFQNYSHFNAPGVGVVNVKKMRIDSITNLPCGICWSTTSPTGPTTEFLANAYGCFNFQGTTTDPVGQYKLGLYISVALQDTSHYDQSVNADIGGIYLYMRVANSGGSCPHVDTSSSGQRLNSSCTFHVGIQETANALHDLTIQPNPMNTEAKVNFTAEQAGNMKVKISTILGSSVYDNTIIVKPGINETNITKGNLTEGIYILTIGNNKGSVSRKFVITD